MSKRPTDLTDLSALSELGPELAEMLVSVASDIALVLDEGGVIKSVALGGAEPMTTTADDWVGRAWLDTVTTDTRKKVEELLRDVSTTGVSRLRHVNHPSPFGLDIPIAYTAVRLGERGPLLAVGRDLRAVAAIQQRLVQTQQEMERDYWQRRQAETRYRFLFQIAVDPVMVVDAETLKVVDANRAAGRLFGLRPEDLTGKAATAGIDPGFKAEVESTLGAVRVTGRAAEIDARMSQGRGSVRIWVTPFHADGANLQLMRLRAVDSLSEAPESGAWLASLAERTSDAIVITDLDGHVVLANPAFLKLVQTDGQEAVKGRLLGDWVGAPGSKLSTMLDRVQKDGTTSLFATTLRGARGHSVEVELSAALVSNGETECIGFILRVAHGRNAQGRAESSQLGGIQLGGKVH